MTLWRLSDTDEWVECEPYDPPKRTLVIDPEVLCRTSETSAIRARIFAAIPAAMARAKKRQADERQGQVSLFALLEQSGAIRRVEVERLEVPTEADAEPVYHECLMDIVERSPRIPGLCHHGQRVGVCGSCVVWEAA